MTSPFCTKCSSAINISTGRCPYCNPTTNTTDLEEIISSQTQEPTKKASFVEKYYRTVKEIITHPRSFFAQTKEQLSLKQGIAFAILTTFVFLSLYYFSNITTTSSFVFVLLIFAVLTLVSPLSLLLNAFGTHCLLILFIPHRAPFRQTFAVYLYSQTAYIIGIIPVIGSFVAFILNIRSVITGLSEVHQVSSLRIFFITVCIPAVLLVILVILCTLILLFVVLVAGVSILELLTPLQDYFTV